jgi:hypothetical protein
VLNKLFLVATFSGRTCHTVALMICVIFLVRLAVMNEGGERRGGEDNRNGGEGANT